MSATVEGFLISATSSNAMSIDNMSMLRPWIIVILTCVLIVSSLEHMLMVGGCSRVGTHQTSAPTHPTSFPVNRANVDSFVFASVVPFVLALNRVNVVNVTTILVLPVVPSVLALNKVNVVNVTTTLVLHVRMIGHNKELPTRRRGVAY